MITRAFAYTGASQSWTVPAGCQSPITVDVKGGGGAGGDTPAAGGRVQATIAVTPGDILYFYVGGASGAPSGTTGGPGGFNGGGAGGNATDATGLPGNGGAGASDIRRNAQTLAARVVVAGGAGASGRGGAGGGPGGEQTGSNGANGTGAGQGLGGSQTAGGAGGVGNPTGNGLPGSLGQGGAGINSGLANYRGGGGGGGGYYGGGAGGANFNTGGTLIAGGGGGGSNYYASTGTTLIAASRGGGAPAAANGSISIAYRLAPDAPTPRFPSNSFTVDRALAQRFSWTYSHPDPADTGQSAYDLRYSSDSGVTWSTVSANTPNAYSDIAGGTFAAGSYQWQVRTYDAQGAVSPWSASSFFTAATAPNGPTITDPASGVAIGSATRTVTFSYPSLTAFRYRVTDGAGVSLVALTTVTDPSARNFTLTGLVNNTTVIIYVAVQSGGLWSAEASSTNPVSYTPPAAPTLTVAADSSSASITASWSTAAGTGGAPNATNAEVHLSIDGGLTDIRVLAVAPVTGSWTYWIPASGVDYSFRIAVTADNGAVNTSPWVGATSGTPSGTGLIYDGGGP